MSKRWYTRLFNVMWVGAMTAAWLCACAAFTVAAGWRTTAQAEQVLIPAAGSLLILLPLGMIFGTLMLNAKDKKGLL